jgi:hypothetical protein
MERAAHAAHKGRSYAVTPQEIFDTVARHLFTQGTQAFDADVARCQYRGPNGTKCAVGCLIPDEAYDPEMEGWIAKALWQAFKDKPGFPQWAAAEVSLLVRLQGVHDTAYAWENESSLRSMLAEVAATYGLNDGVLDGLKWGNK